MTKLIMCILLLLATACASIAKKEEVRKPTEHQIVVQCANEFLAHGAPPIFAMTVCKCLVENEVLTIKDPVERDITIQMCAIKAEEATRKEKQNQPTI